MYDTTLAKESAPEQASQKHPVDLFQGKPPITNWKEFGRIIRSEGCQLLRRLDDFPNSIIVTGCQRSGTTMTGELIGQSDELVDYSFGREISLDAALLLSGYVAHEPSGRYCFQTTWLNQCYREYLEHSNDHKIVWVLRNPFSVVRSMLYNWPVGALDELFVHCGASELPPSLKRNYRLLTSPALIKLQLMYFDYKGKGARFLQRERFNPDKRMFLNFNSDLIFSGVSKLERACYAYNGKVSQIFELASRLSSEQLLILEYNNLVSDKHNQVPRLFDFVGLTYREQYADMIHTQSIKKAETLTAHEREMIERICVPVYEEAQKLVSPI